MTYACLNCQERFTKSEAFTHTEYEPTEAFGVRQSVAVECIACPACGKTNIEEYTPETDEEGEDDWLDMIDAKREQEHVERKEFLIGLACPWKKQA